MTMANNLHSTVEQYPIAAPGSTVPAPVSTNPFRQPHRPQGGASEEPEDEFSTEAEGHDGVGRGVRGSSSGSNPGTTGNSPGAAGASGVGAAARGASSLGATYGSLLAKRKR